MCTLFNFSHQYISQLIATIPFTFIIFLSLFLPKDILKKTYYSQFHSSLLNSFLFFLNLNPFRWASSPRERSFRPVTSHTHCEVQWDAPQRTGRDESGYVIETAEDKRRCGGTGYYLNDWGDFSLVFFFLIASLKHPFFKLMFTVFHALSLMKTS